MTTIQLDLFGNSTVPTVPTKAPKGKTDTSHEAAAMVEAQGIAERQHEQILALLAREDMTGGELAHALTLPTSTVSGRLNTLTGKRYENGQTVQLGAEWVLAVKTGEKRLPKAGGRGVRQEIWTLTDAGRELARKQGGGE
jgi:predicted ArsR family transcriptional regulator